MCTYFKLENHAEQLPDIWGQGIPPPQHHTPQISHIPKGKGCMCVSVQVSDLPHPEQNMTTQPSWNAVQTKSEKSKKCEKNAEKQIFLQLIWTARK